MADKLRSLSHLTCVLEDIAKHVKTLREHIDRHVPEGALKDESLLALDECENKATTVVQQLLI